MKHREFQITLRDTQPKATESERMKRRLKMLKRYLGFACVRWTPVEAEPDELDQPDGFAVFARRGLGAFKFQGFRPREFIFGFMATLTEQGFDVKAYELSEVNAAFLVKESQTTEEQS